MYETQFYMVFDFFAASLLSIFIKSFSYQIEVILREKCNLILYSMKQIYELEADVMYKL